MGLEAENLKWICNLIWDKLVNEKIYSSLFSRQTLAKTRPPLGTNFSEGKQLFYDLSALHPHATIGPPNKDVQIIHIRSNK